ncbi:hypothetical protein PsYK624_088190 [Phanerochaete sordida]|uniref:Uncharacterized protein n=1 Tax=Phanerochaete sordida TaxID=48140 RepID=A0A9P3LFI4_9APHY|nr:hypothetical protein PsYK624_088190 [Phanerochaete sordida]
MSGYGSYYSQNPGNSFSQPNYAQQNGVYYPPQNGGYGQAYNNGYEPHDRAPADPATAVQSSSIRPTGPPALTGPPAPPAPPVQGYVPTPDEAGCCSSCVIC